MKYPENVIKIMNIMSRHGYRAYAVGGCVRDVVMGREPSDWDMTTNASPEKMIEIFALEGVRTIPTGLKHGTVTVLLDNETYELTTFRIDGIYTDSRHPDEVIFTSNIEDDLARRDFTVNAMAAAPAASTPAASTPAVGEPAVGKAAADETAVDTPAVSKPAVGEPAVGKAAADETAVSTPAVGKPAVGKPTAEKSDDQVLVGNLAPKTAEIIDVFGGIEDINNKIIRAVGEPERRFREDALRILRAVRFAASLGFEIEENTKKAAVKLACGLQKVSIERKIVELKKTLLSNGADEGIDLIFELGLAKYIHPDIKKPSRSLLTLPAKFETRMAALFFENACLPDLSSLKLSRNESQSIKKLCNKKVFCAELSEKNARRMIYEYGELAYDATLLNKSPELAEIIKVQAKNSPCVTVAALDVSGNDLIAEGIEPRSIGKITAYLLDRVIDEPKLNKKETLLALAKGFEV